MTNDTEFAEHVTNPDHKVPKTYQVKAATLLSEEQIERLRRGVELKRRPDAPGRGAPAARQRQAHAYLEMTITEGRNRQVRRMIEAVGSKVLKLVRTAIGPMRIGDLAIGKWRKLAAEELSAFSGRLSARVLDDHDRPATRSGLSRKRKLREGKL